MTTMNCLRKPQLYLLCSDVPAYVLKLTLKKEKGSAANNFTTPLEASLYTSYIFLYILLLIHNISLYIHNIPLWFIHSPYIHIVIISSYSTYLILFLFLDIGILVGTLVAWAFLFLFLGICMGRHVLEVGDGHFGAWGWAGQGMEQTWSGTGLASFLSLCSLLFPFYLLKHLASLHAACLFRGSSLNNE